MITTSVFLGVWLGALVGLLWFKAPGEVLGLFLLGYSWNWAMSSPRLRERASQTHYRFSFVRICLAYNQAVHKLLSRIPLLKKPLIVKTLSILSVFTFVTLFLESGKFILIYLVVGSLLFEAVYWLLKFWVSPNFQDF